MGVQEMALMLLGIGILSERFGGGRGLSELGTGIQTLVAAPLTGTGTGLSSLAGGIRDISGTFGDLGRGISALLGSFQLPQAVGPGGSGSGMLPSPGGNGGLPVLPPLNGGGGGARAGLLPDAGGSGATLLPGGGGNVPGASFSFVEPSAFIRATYSVTPGLHAGLGVPGYWVSNTPLQDKPAGGSTLI